MILVGADGSRAGLDAVGWAAREAALRDVPIAAAVDAELLVAGSHGHGTFAGMVLGSVSQELLHQSPCPLAVVRSVR